jgi:phage gp29-like protein
MLRIAIPATTISAKVFEQNILPTPPNGTETDVGGELVLLFEDEEEAVAYLDELEDYSTELDNKSPEKPVINALVSAINNDEFVQAYLR